MLVGIYLAAILSILHFISGVFVEFTKKHREKLLSLSAGVLISILFIEIVPRFSLEVSRTNLLLFLIPLLGFVAFHSIRAHNFRHIKQKREMKKRNRRNHILAFFIEHFILGLSLTLIFKDLLVSLVLFFPFILLTVSSSVLLDIIDKTSRTGFPKLILGSSTFLGALVGSLFTLNKLYFIGALGYAMGALFYIVARDIMPVEEQKENPVFFFTGLFITLVLLLIKGIS